MAQEQEKEKEDYRKTHTNQTNASSQHERGEITTEDTSNSNSNSYTQELTITSTNKRQKNNHTFFSAAANEQKKEITTTTKESHLFSYEDLNELGKLARQHKNINFEKGYMASPINPGYATILSINKEISQKKAGWKFHLTIDDQDPENIAKAWEVVQKIMLNHKVSCFKILLNNANQSQQKILNKNAENTQGKQICIYQFQDPELDWQAIVTEIQTEFVAKKINPSSAPTKDRKLSEYIYYRNDADTRGEYIRSGLAQSFNDAKADNPFEAFHDLPEFSQYKADSEKSKAEEIVSETAPVSEVGSTWSEETKTIFKPI